MFIAVSCLSPVSIHTLIPAWASSAIVSGTLGCTRMHTLVRKRPALTHRARMRARRARYTRDQTCSLSSFAVAVCRIRFVSTLSIASSTAFGMILLSNLDFSAMLLVAMLNRSRNTTYSSSEMDRYLRAT